jgi:hypothetical protein
LFELRFVFLLLNIFRPSLFEGFLFSLAEKN